jgi:hypothetical protein
MSESEKEFRRRKTEARHLGLEAAPVAVQLSEHGWAADQAEKQCSSLVRNAVEKKLGKLASFREALRHDLVVCEEGPIVGDRRKVMSMLRPWIRGSRDSHPLLGKVSLIVSLDLLYDLGGEDVEFSYVEWASSEDRDIKEFREFSDRAAYAAQLSASEAVWKHLASGRPVYSQDARGRLVKETADGRRLQVRVTEQGGEVIVRELSKG